MAAGAAVFLGFALAATGCVSIKLETALQRSPGVVTLRGIVCASDYDHSTYDTCQASNVQETDNIRSDSDQNTTGLGQLMLGFRVPDGSVAPGSFLTEAADASFTQSPTYTQALRTKFPPAAGFHWVGYISTPKTFNPKNQPADREARFNPEFTLPPTANGAPFLGPFRWRLVVGFRSIADVGHAGDPVDCSATFLNTCWDSPPEAVVPTTPTTGPLQKAVSDFGVLAGTAASAGQGETVSVTFPVRYSDLGALGARTLSISATSTVPGASAQPNVTSLNIAPNTTPTVTVSLTVPPATRLGTYKVSLTAVEASSAPTVQRLNTADVTVVDRTAPSIRISTPANGSTFTQGQTVVADYGCTDETNGSGLAACSGPVPSGAAIDTGSVGPKTFTVTSSDNAGNATTLTRSYTVVAPPPPSQTVVINPTVKPERVNVTVSFAFGATAKATTLRTLVVKNVPAGATVKATCKGRGCPSKKVKGKRRAISFTKKNAFNVVKLKPWVKKRLPAGTVLTVTVTKLGSFGMVKKVAIRAGKSPLVTTSCLMPDSKAPAACE